jgi:hypothetical protein
MNRSSKDMAIPAWGIVFFDLQATQSIKNMK